MAKRRSWIIEVCRFCDGLATWPFRCCVEGPAARERGERWTVLVTVYSNAKRPAESRR